MALKVWLPLNGDLENKGISNGTVATTATNIWNDNGKIGKCILSNAKASYTFPELTNITNFSISYWIYIDSSVAVSNWADIWGINCVAGNSSTVIRDEFKSAVGVHQLLMGKDSTVGSNTNTYIGTGMNDSNAKDKWVHIALVKDNTTAKVYTNGVLTNIINSSTFESTPQKLTGYLIIGNTASSAAKLNDFRIYDHCLSAKEVKEISQGLILHYKLDGFSGGTGENILPNTTSEIRSYEYPSSSFKDQFAVITTKIPEAEKYTLSFYAKSTVAGDKIRAHYYSPNTTTTCVSSQGITKTASDGNIDFTLSTDWQLYWVTYTQTSTTAVKHVILPRMGAVGNTNGVVSGTGIVSIKCVKMEEGEQVTSWTPALSEMGIDTSKITDSSGYGNDGIITGNVTTRANDSKEGRYNISTYIPLGSTDYITTQNPIGNPSDAITMSIWFKSSNTSPGNSYHEIFNHATSSQYFEFAIQNNGLFRAGMVINGTRYVANTAQLGLLDGNWHMLSMTYDGATIIRYVDGISRSTTSITGSLTGANGSFLLGHYGPNTSYHAKEAYLADARIYATALSAEDIADLYHTPANIDNLGGIHGFEFIEKTPNLLNSDPREWTKESSVTCVWNEETGYFDVNTNRDTSVTSRWGVYTGVPIKPSTAYLFSAEVLDNKSYIGVAGGTSSRSLPSNIISWNGEKRYYYFFTTSSSHTHAWVYLCSKPSETTAGHFKNIYLGEVGEIASIKQNGIFENEDMVEYNENGRITKSGELAGSNFIEK